MDICKELRSSISQLSYVHPSVSCGQNFNVRYYTQTFQPDSFIHAMFIGTIDFYQSVPLSMTLTLAGGHMVSTKQNFLALFARMLFN